MRWIALLRGINVGGHAIIKMASLKQSFERFGADDVSTYITSGNVIFSSTTRDATKLGRALEAHLEGDLGHAGRVLVRSRADLVDAAGHNPFDPARHDPEHVCHLMFLDEKPAAARARSLPADGEIRAHLEGRVLYFTYPRAVAGNRRNLNFEKLLGVVGTARTWKVVDKLIELAA